MHDSIYKSARFDHTLPFRCMLNTSASRTRYFITASPLFSDLRGIHTIVVILFDRLDDGRVKVTLSHHGWGEGNDWQGVYDYFDRAWGYVLTNFAKSFQ